MTVKWKWAGGVESRHLYNRILVATRKYNRTGKYVTLGAVILSVYLCLPAGTTRRCVRHKEGRWNAGVKPSSMCSFVRAVRTWLRPSAFAGVGVKSFAWSIVPMRGNSATFKTRKADMACTNTGPDVTVYLCTAYHASVNWLPAPFFPRPSRRLPVRLFRIYRNPGNGGGTIQLYRGCDRCGKNDIPSPCFPPQRHPVYYILFIRRNTYRRHAAGPFPTTPVALPRTPHGSLHGVFVARYPDFRMCRCIMRLPVPK